MKGHGELKVTAIRPSDADGYLMSAQDFWRGLRDLTNCDSGALISSGLLASQATECVLKAYLSLKGMPTKELRKIGHDLVLLWDNAHKLGFPLDHPAPHWVKALAAGHAGPDYFFRYPLGLNGIAIPAPSSLVTAIEAMIDHVYATARGA